MKITIIGSGYVGLVNGACLSEMGNIVTCVDIDEKKIERLKQADIPIYEPGLDNLIEKNIKTNRLSFSNKYEPVKDSDVIFIAVGTPPYEDGSADLQYVLNAAHKIGEIIERYTIVVIKSTVPVGTSIKVQNEIKKVLQERNCEVEFGIASNPEFLKEGTAINDCLHPDRIIVGTIDEKVEKIMKKLYEPFILNKVNVIFTDIASSEIIKYASNSMLATRISFSNEIANFCEKVGANYEDVKLGIGADTRIGNKFLNAGCGYGGSCFPKDVKALIKTAEDNGCSMKILNAVEEVNEKQKHILFKKINKLIPLLKGKTITLLGLSFKPETDDMREATSLVLIDDLLKKSAKIKVYDPIAMNECKKRIGDSVTYCSDIYDAVLDTDALILVTEWDVFKEPNWDKIKRNMRGNIVIDGRNYYNKNVIESMGFLYEKIG